MNSDMNVQIKKAGPFELSESAISKISLLKESEDNKFFRVYVTGGGCSGFQYGFKFDEFDQDEDCLLYTSPSPRDRPLSRMPSSA